CCQVVMPGEVPYLQAWNWQKQRLHLGLANPKLPDGLMLLTHPPVYTLGQGGDLRWLKFDPQQPSREVYRVERGGEVTYHGPGQWVAYPIVCLKRHRCDLHWYLRQLEEVVIRMLAGFGIPGERLPGLTGVWVEGCKVAAVGIRVTRWWTYHGLAVNVCPDLEAFAEIVPCGIADRPVGSLVQFCPELTMAAVGEALLSSFAEQFGWVYHPLPLERWLSPKKSDNNDT
ncbi:MAG: lipoyl(octanoyl) transferase LipB, partial [Thermostichales cyanobacterium SRBZ-1_bins_19]